MVFSIQEFFVETWRILDRNTLDRSRNSLLDDAKIPRQITIINDWGIYYHPRIWTKAYIISGGHNLGNEKTQVIGSELLVFKIGAFLRMEELDYAWAAQWCYPPNHLVNLAPIST